MRTAADGGIRQLPSGREREYLRATTFFSLFQSHADGFSQPAPFKGPIKDAKDVFLWLVWARECLELFSATVLARNFAINTTLQR